jgi:iron(III) transport system substrate-binding protein
MIRPRLSLVVAALVISVVCVPLAGAQDARVVDAAKKEGKVVWYTSLVLPSAEKVAKLFEAAYPGIKVEVHRTGSQRILQRVMQELQANIKNVDVIHTSDAGHFVLLKDKKLLMPYTPVGIDKFPASFKDKDGYYFGLRATVNSIVYNTKLVAAAEAPKSWKDLLDPKWKGKARDRASRLQRRDCHPRARPRASARMGLLQATRAEPADDRAIRE